MQGATILTRRYVNSDWVRSYAPLPDWCPVTLEQHTDSQQPLHYKLYTGIL